MKLAKVEIRICLVGIFWKFGTKMELEGVSRVRVIDVTAGFFIGLNSEENR